MTRPYLDTLGTSARFDDVVMSGGLVIGELIVHLCRGDVGASTVTFACDVEGLTTTVCGSVICDDVSAVCIVLRLISFPWSVLMWSERGASF